jgi:hypothetical protein
VPQSSVLGPILFLIYINDVDSACKGSSILQLFADDAKLYSRVSVDDHANFLQLSHLSSSNYLINGTQIPVHSSCVDLGVIINDDLSFRDHRNKIVSKARQRTSVLLRALSTADWT